ALRPCPSDRDGRYRPVRRGARRSRRSHALAGRPCDNPLTTTTTITPTTGESMKSNIRTFLLAAALGLGLGLGGVAHAQNFINVLTGGTSGIYYPLGVALSQIYGKAIPEAK